MPLHTPLAIAADHFLPHP